MPLLTVTIKSNGSTNEKDCLSRAIHAASIAAGCARAAQAAGLPTVEQALASLGSVERELICLIPS